MIQKVFWDLVIGIMNKILRINNPNNKIGISSIKKEISYDFELNFKKIYTKCKKYTMTSIERMHALYDATKYVIINKIQGEIVECGVWKGGSMMLCALTLLQMNNTEKKIYLYDTYEGMNEPTNRDSRIIDDKMAFDFLENKDKKDNPFWAYSSLEEVKGNFQTINYPKNKIEYIKGAVEKTIPDIIPKEISILRLDTDWYESTYHELKYLYPRLSKNGILIIDDYGYWKGSREATDKYFKENHIKMFLHRIDHTGRIGIKLN